MKKKKLLILGATVNQLPFVQKAKARNIYTITLDNVPSNICHKYSDEYKNISTIDQELILNYTKEKRVDGIVTCASDLALPSVAYICNKLKLPSVSHEAVLTTINKDLFRLFQMKNNIKCPKAFIFTNIKEALTKNFFLNKKWVIKPVDSSGSKGVTLINTNSKTNYKNAITKAFSFSRSKKIVVEEYIKGTDCSVDGFINNGKIDILCITNKLLTPFPGLIPVGHTLPSKLSSSIQLKIEQEIKKILKLLKIETSPFDFDIIVTKNKEIIILEMSLRIGGNGIPYLINFATGYNLYDTTISFALNENIPNVKYEKKPLFTGVFLICSPASGKLISIASKESLLSKYHDCLKEVVYDLAVDDRVEKFTQGNHRLGHIIIQTQTAEELNKMYTQIMADLNMIIEKE